MIHLHAREIAARYTALHGARAVAQLDAEISRSIGRADWEEFARLQSARRRLARLALFAQAGRRLKHALRWPGASSAIGQMTIDR